MSERRRVLLGVLVYNGRDVVPTCLRSAVAVSQEHHDVDVVVFDDCSPDLAWRDELDLLCEDLGIGRYRSPRNLGIPRNMNLVLGWGAREGYDHVAIVNSDTVMPRNLVDAVVPALESSPRIASLTPWSNNVSVFSIPNDGQHPLLRTPDHVDRSSQALQDEFGAEVLEIPSGVGYCMFMPRGVVEDVGRMDPIFGRGYCEEVDWCQRARAAGYRNVLGLGSFVYHEGSASTTGAGLLAHGATTVVEHEEIVDARHPDYRDRVHTFLAERVMERYTGRAAQAIVVGAARSLGYEVQVAVAAREAALPTFNLAPDGRPGVVVGHHAGFRAEIDVGSPDVIDGLERLTGRGPTTVRIHDRDRGSSGLLEAAEARQVDIRLASPYPSTLPL